MPNADSIQYMNVESLPDLLAAGWTEEHLSDDFPYVGYDYRVAKREQGVVTVYHVADETLPGQQLTHFVAHPIVQLTPPAVA